MSRYDELQKVLRWCRTHSRTEFTYTDVGIHPLKLKGFSTSKFRGKIWLVSAGKFVSRDGVNGLRKYRLAEGGWMIKTTQNWEIGDCLELLPSIETGSVDMVLCDLPYQITACAWDTIIPFEPLWKEWKRITKDNAAIVLSARQPFTSMLVMSNREMFKYEWVWIKNRGTGHLNAKKHPLVGHETVLVFAEGMTTYNPQMSIGTPYKRLNCARQSTNKGCYAEMDVTTDTINDGTRYPISCIEFDKVERTSHPTQKPVALFEYLIRTHTNEGDTVHDSCLGSGTTLEACRKTNRNCIGFEISDEWEHLYADRCMAHTPTLQSFFGEEDTT